jgi:hypothetical protein
MGPLHCFATNRYCTRPEYFCLCGENDASVMSDVLLEYNSTHTQWPADQTQDEYCWSALLVPWSWCVPKLTRRTTSRRESRVQNALQEAPNHRTMLTGGCGPRDGVRGGNANRTGATGGIDRQDTLVCELFDTLRWSHSLTLPTLVTLITCSCWGVVRANQHGPRALPPTSKDTRSLEHTPLEGSLALVLNNHLDDMDPSNEVFDPCG